MKGSVHVSPLLILISVILLLSGSIGLYLYTQSKSEKYTGPVEEIKLGVSKAAPQLSALIYIAESQHYFTDQGLDVKQIPEENGIIAQQNAVKGVTDIATTVEFAFVSDSFTYDSMRILATIDRAEFVEIIARRDKNIATLTDLKGKRIGVVAKSASEFSMGRYLLSNSILLKDIAIVYLTFAQMQEAIVSGRVDAVATNDPFAYKIKTVLGTNNITWPAQEDDSVYWLVVSSDNFIKAHPQRVERFLKALFLAEKYVKSNPEESKKIVAEKLKLEKDYLDQTWKKSIFTLSLDQSLLVTMEAEARWRIANKLTDEILIPNYNDFIYTEALRKVNLEAVSLY